MTTEEMNFILTERFLELQSPFAHWRLNGNVWFKRLTSYLLSNEKLWSKRSFDIGASLILLLLLSPLLLLIALAIKWEARGPVFFIQMRVGQGGWRFPMIKFRSMYANAEQHLQNLLAQNENHEGVTFKIKNDPRITRVGKWLRRLSLDELPQLINVLKGNMSLVGPRPPLPREVAMYSAAERRRLLASPGITCLWQIGGRAEIDFQGQVQLDIQYIESQSFMGDIGILLKTIPAVLSGRGAY